MRTILALTLFALSACATQSVDSGSTVGVTRHTGRPITLVLDRADGSPFDFGALRGKAILVVAFAIDDMRSMATMRDAELVARAHPDSLVVVGVCAGDYRPYQFRQLLQVYAQSLELRSTTLLTADSSVRDGTSALGVIQGVPTVMLINRAGVLSRTEQGIQSRAELERIVAPALPPGA